MKAKEKINCLYLKEKKESEGRGREGGRKRRKQRRRKRSTTGRREEQNEMTMR